MLRVTPDVDEEDERADGNDEQRNNGERVQPRRNHKSSFPCSIRMERVVAICIQKNINATSGSLIPGLRPMNRSMTGSESSFEQVGDVDDCDQVRGNRVIFAMASEVVWRDWPGCPMSIRSPTVGASLLPERLDHATTVSCCAPRNNLRKLDGGNSSATVVVA